MNMMNKKFKLIVALGNPGKKYLNTRHNAGFIILDNYINKEGLGTFEDSKKFHGEILKKEDTVFLKPQTFMNLSGKSVLEAITFFKISPDELLVIQDDIDLAFGKVKISFDSSDAGHNGIKDIISKLGTKSFYRLRFGVGKPADFTPVEDFVLNDFTANELQELENFKLGDYLN